MTCCIEWHRFVMSFGKPSALNPIKFPFLLLCMKGEGEQQAFSPQTKLGISPECKGGGGCTKRVQLLRPSGCSCFWLCATLSRSLTHTHTHTHLHTRIHYTIHLFMLLFEHSYTVSYQHWSSLSANLLYYLAPMVSTYQHLSLSQPHSSFSLLWERERETSFFFILDDGTCRLLNILWS